MARERPASVLTMGILNLVFGGLGLICLCVGAFGLAVLFGLVGATKELEDLMAAIERELPAFRAIMIAQIALGVLLNIVLLAAGVGLLNMQPWARWASVGWAVTIILLQVASLIFTLAIVNPAMEKATKEWASKQKGATVSTSPGSGMQQSVSSICGAAFNIIYAIALLIVMFLPNVSAAFAGRPIQRRPFGDEGEGGDRPPQGRWGDEY
jgi:hypothetical protein